MEPKTITTEEVLNKLKNKDFNLHFFTVDTKGTALASVAHTYQIVDELNKNGYNATILHEKPMGLKDKKGGLIGYTPVDGWLGKWAMELPHQSIESLDKKDENNLNISAEDFVIIPELFSSVMEATKSFPSKQIVLVQNYDYIYDIMGMGMTWNRHYGITDAITTTDGLGEYVTSLFPGVRTTTLPIGIPDYFEAEEDMLPKKPTIAIHTRDQGDAARIVKTFYAKYPTLKWVTFRDLRNVTREQYAMAMKESCLHVWLDDRATVGTSPIEAAYGDTPTIAKIPNSVPEWMAGDEPNTLNNHGVWVNSTLDMPDVIAEYMQLWLEDSVPENLINGVNELKKLYKEDAHRESVVSVFEGFISARIQHFEGIEKQRIEALEKLEVK